MNDCRLEVGAWRYIPVSPSGQGDLVFGSR